jgi:hypothetical protein
MIVFFLILLGILIFLVTWRFSNLFLSRRDFYQNSPINLFKIRLKLSLTAGLFPIVLWYLVFHEVFKNKDTKLIIPKSKLVNTIYSKPDINSNITYQGKGIEYKKIDSTNYKYFNTISTSKGIGYSLK